MTTLATLEDFAAARGTTADPTDIGAVLALEGASDAIRTFCNRRFDYVKDDEVMVDGNGSRTILLEPPIVDVTEVTVTFNDETVTLDPAGYTFNGPVGILYRTSWVSWPWGPGWPWGYGNIGITYSHGYILPGEEGANLPADLVDVCIALASTHLTRQQSGGQVVQSETMGRYSVTYASRTDVSVLSDIHLNVLRAYRLPIAA